MTSYQSTSKDSVLIEIIAIMAGLSALWTNCSSCVMMLKHGWLRWLSRDKTTLTRDKTMGQGSQVLVVKTKVEMMGVVYTMVKQVVEEAIVYPLSAKTFTSSSDGLTRKHDVNSGY